MQPMDGPVMDTAEQVYISSLALLKVPTCGSGTSTLCYNSLHPITSIV